MYIVKKCSKCKEHKSLEFFSKDLRASFGVSPYCKSCISKISKVYREKNMYKLIEYQKKRSKQKRKTDSLYKMKGNIRSLVYISMKNKGYTKSSRTYKILGCDFETFKKHIERQFTKGMNWNNQGEWHYDHIIPISSAQTEEEVIKLNHYTNFQPLWAKDNFRKSNNIEPTQIKMRM